MTLELLFEGGRQRQTSLRIEISIVGTVEIHWRTPP